MTQIHAYVTDSGCFPENDRRNLPRINMRYERRYKEAKTGHQKSGALAASLLLQCFAGIGPEEEILCNEYGKPYVPGKPFFSISHSDGLTVLAVSHEENIGIDIERIDRVTPRIIQKVSRYDTAAASQTELAREWTRVEAALKLKGTGFYSDPLKTEEARACYSSCDFDGHVITCASAAEHVFEVQFVSFVFKDSGITFNTENIQKGL